MNRSFPWRAAAVLICLLLMPAVSLLFGLAAQSSAPKEGTCLGLPILSSDIPVSEGITPPQIFYQGEPAALDGPSGTLYLSISAPQGVQAYELTGTLAAADREWTLSFAPDPAFFDLSAAIAQGHAFRLLASSNKGTASLRVVFTPLPVVCMNTTDDSDYSDPYAEHSGTVRVFEPSADTPASSQANWHRRGMTTRLFKKGSWKLSLTNSFGKSRNLAFAGLGADDDWILNSMGMDDLKLREKLIMDLWNGMQADTENGLRMSSGEYVEVVLDGEYMGLYLLQRRVDVKYLGLEKLRDIVLKGGNYVGEMRSVQDAFTIKDSPLPQEATYALAESLFTMDDLSVLDADSFVDMELFVLFGALYDNLSFRNAYYILSPEHVGYRIRMLPWDTDLAFGLRYVNNKGYVLLDDHETTLPFEHRREYDAMKALHPDLDARIAARWQALRSGVLSDENVFAILGGIMDRITLSGALARDRVLWGTRYGEGDTFEALETCIRNRLSQLDAMYLP